MSSRALRKLQNDEGLLASILESKEATVERKKETKTPQKVNMFALMNNEDSGSDSEHDSSENSDIPVVKTPALLTKSQKKRQKKKNKQKQKQMTRESSDSEVEHNSEDDRELDVLLQEYRKKDIKKQNERQRKNEDVNSDEDYITASDNDEENDLYKIDNEKRITGDLMNDCTFEKFPVKYLKHATRFFNQDIKKLDPHSEFKLLFDDISPESLEDIDSVTSTSISPQQLKQIQRMKRLVRNWGGKNHRTVPNGPGGSTHTLKFTKVREDWIPTPRGELGMKLLNTEDLIDWQLWQRPTDWKDVIEEDLKKWKKSVSFYRFEPLDTDLSRKAMTEFYLSVLVHPDHEALINLISSKFPYHIPSLLQVALITIRQGDRSNTNGLLQRALFVFDRALKASINFDALSCNLPYIYFFNRQFYLAIFRYILALAQKGAITTAAEWCKVLWSLSPAEDPLGCRYFMDHYLLLNNDYQYIIDVSKSPLMNSYRQWYTLGISLATVYSYLKIDDNEQAKRELKKCFYYHGPALATLLVEKLVGDSAFSDIFDINVYSSELLEVKAYMARFSAIWKDPSDINFLHQEIFNILNKYKEDKSLLDPRLLVETEEEEQENPFFINGIPINLLRFAILSEESSIMAGIPPYIWSEYEVYEFDVLPPQPTSKESLDVLENVKSFINDKDLAVSQAAMLQDEHMMNQIRQLSLQQYIQQNDTEVNE
ncbi:similar to Saccharomyces cerevisiae YDR333C Putative protein of unknown function [Maudiozyma saulgeensis]|uniref:Ribosome quality control complex subunit 1 n=1 Tax=Maudiozyma saulgeensis TaxID=1789683 RepID=A0A1X7R387_9SACH|nr:similar to Saccharomyces cerevisiae YDR333C Putative protein of unknown function [Kazachstania saulgeensis]